MEQTFETYSEHEEEFGNFNSKEPVTKYYIFSKNTFEKYYISEIIKHKQQNHEIVKIKQPCLIIYTNPRQVAAVIKYISKDFY